MTLWAVTSYFNPKRFVTRYQNFLAFRDGLRVPLLTVQWAQAGDFELAAADSDLLVSLSGGDLMWQKERLLNLGIARLPRECDRVAWLDCDILFEDAHWVEELDGELSRVPIAQLFSAVAHGSPGRGDGRGESLLVRESLVAAWARDSHGSLAGRLRSAALEPDAGADGSREIAERSRLAGRPSAGHAWAARRALLARHGLYDRCVSGTGDMAIALAAIGRPELFGSAFPLSRHQRRDYRAWAGRFAAAIGGRVGCLGSRIQHLFHGNLADRQYRTRLGWMVHADFDPASDLVLDEQSLYRFAPGRGLRDAAAMGRYFRGRAEDEAPRPVAGKAR